MADGLLATTLGATGWPEFRLGLSASCRPGREAILAAMDRGVNYFFGYGFDSQMLGTLRDVFKARRAQLIVATGGYNWVLWRSLLRWTRGWPGDQRIPTPGQAYRFVLSNPHVDVVLTAPSNMRQLQQNLAALDEGPPSEGEMAVMRAYGDAVHHTKKWFM